MAFDAFAIDAVGVYLSRQGLFILWSLEELLATLADSAQVSLPELRASFRDAVLAARPARVAAPRRRARD